LRCDDQLEIQTPMIGVHIAVDPARPISAKNCAPNVWCIMDACGVDLWRGVLGFVSEVGLVVK